MDLINTNHLRVSVIRWRRDMHGWLFNLNVWESSDHGKPRKETTWYVCLWPIATDIKYRPDGKA